MILINLGHPLSEGNVRELESIVGEEVERLVEVPVQLDPDAPFARQVAELAERVGLTPREWQTEAIVVNPPALNVAAAALLAELHGRMGYFPPLVRLCPVPGGPARRYQVAEVMDLQQLREAARQRRTAPVRG
jgi:hypothetical protein